MSAMLISFLMLFSLCIYILLLRSPPSLQAGVTEPRVSVEAAIGWVMEKFWYGVKWLVVEAQNLHRRFLSGSESIFSFL